MVGAEMTDLAKVASADVVILAVPLDAYPDLLKELVSLIKPETLLLDICSVKIIPEQYYEEYFPEHPNLLLTHPLFGPQSASEETKGHKLVVTKSKGELAEHVLAYAEHGLELEIHTMSSRDHDEFMAQVHVLTFFVARGLSNLRPKKGPFVTPSYKMIMDLVAFDQTHSDELFHTIQDGNPLAEEMRQRVVKSFVDLEASLTKSKAKD
jgi:prephenate dehydrogenase